MITYRLSNLFTELKHAIGLFVVTLLVSISMVVAVLPSTVIAAVIPIGCPGSTVPGPPAAGVCEAIPPGCPGASASGPPAAGVCEAIPPGCPGASASGTPAPGVCDAYLAKFTSGGTATAGTPDPITNDCNGDVIKAGAAKGDSSHCAILDILLTITNTLSAIVGVAVVLTIVVGGIKYSMAADDPAQITAAKERIRNGLIALVTFVFMYGFLQWLIPGGIF